jgi:monoamine oxidase
MSFTRRDFLSRVGQLGGYSATFATMQALGLMPMKAEQMQSVKAESGVGKGKKLVVVGAGVAGLCTAYEAKKLGYEVTLLEAMARPGGRVWTGRNGDKLEFVDGSTQTIEWSKGLYQNMGAGRLPSIHGTTLGYVREFNIPMEVEVNTSRSTLLQNDRVNGGKAYTQRKVINDSRGHVSELLAKSVAGGTLDQEFDADDKKRLMDFLSYYGPLEKGTYKYKGSDRADIKQYPGAGPVEMIINEDTIPLDTLLKANFLGYEMYEEAWDWQATMFQPVGGMDAIPMAFAKRLGDSLILSAPVKAIKKTAKGVTVTYTHDGAEKHIAADYCVCAMPLTILRKIDADLDPAHRDAVTKANYRGSYKIPWEAPRFWETDYNIYGGLSFLAQGVSPLWYPSANLFSDRGILVAGYQDESIGGLDKMTPEQVFAHSKASVERLHPGHSKLLEKPVFMSWRRFKWFEGSWIGTQPAAEYDVMNQPDGDIYFAGDAMSHIVGWQEGALLSGIRALQMISDKVKSA